MIREESLKDVGTPKAERPPPYPLMRGAVDVELSGVSIVPADLAIVLREDSLHVIGQHFLQHQITGR